MKTIQIGEVLSSFDSARRPIKGAERVPGTTPYLGASGVVDFVDGFTHDGSFLCVSEDGENLKTRKLPIAWVQDGQFWANNHLHVLGGVDRRRLKFIEGALAVIDLSGYLTGSTQPKLTKTALLLIRIPDLGPRMETAIGEVLGALDDKIAANRRIIEASTTLATQIVGRAAGGPDKPLSVIAEIQMGSSPRGADLNEVGDGMEFFQGVRDFGALSPSPRVFATTTPRRAQAGDTLLAVRAPVGEVNWARNETCIGRGLAAVRSADAPATIHYLLRRFAGRWDEHEGSGTVFSSVTGPQVKAMQFPTVPEASADEVEHLLASIHQRALGAEEESEVLARARDELLPLLMSGRISVRDAERTVEDVL